MRRVLQTRAVAQPPRIANSESKEVYRPQWIPVRPGSQDHERVPSRRPDGRYYRDGRVEAIND